MNTEEHDDLQLIDFTKKISLKKPSKNKEKKV